jgi:hypothetical protein
MVTGKTGVAVPSDESHCVVTEGNPAVCELEVGLEIITHNVILFGPLARVCLLTI